MICFNLIVLKNINAIKNFYNIIYSIYTNNTNNTNTIQIIYKECKNKIYVNI